MAFNGVEQPPERGSGRVSGAFGHRARPRLCGGLPGARALYLQGAGHKNALILTTGGRHPERRDGLHTLERAPHLPWQGVNMTDTARLVDVPWLLTPSVCSACGAGLAVKP